MPILFFSKGIRYSISNKTSIVKIIKSIIKNEKKKLGSINFTFCSDRFLSDMNNKFLKHSTLTDIITFQYPNDKLSGEVFISIDRVKDNATKFDNSTKQELYRVVIHGILHMCGYADKKVSDKKRMKEKEEYYLKMTSIK